MTRALRVQHIGPVTRLTLNRPRRLNALDHDLRSALADALEAAGANDASRAVVLTGAGTRAFCAGQDLHESQALGDAREGGWIQSWSRLFEAFLSFPKPIVAALNGVTAGGGLEMALFCDIRIASTDAALIMAEIDVGLPAMTGSAWLSAHVFDSRMLEIVLTGRRVDAGEAQRIGLISEQVTPRRLGRRALQVATGLASRAPLAMRLTVHRFRALRAARLERSGLMTRMPQYHSEAMASGEPQRIMQAFLAKRAGHGQSCGSHPTTQTGDDHD